MREAVKVFIGPRVSEMIEIGGLATRPDRQGRGYASALVRIATARVCLLPLESFQSFKVNLKLRFVLLVGGHTGPGVLACIEQYC